MTDVSDIDQQLAALGSVPGDLDELLARYGEDDLSGAHIDSLLDSLSAGVEQAQVEALGVESVPPPAETGTATGTATATGAGSGAAHLPPRDRQGGAPRIRHDTMVDRPSVPVQADGVDVHDELEGEYRPALALDALFSDPDGDDLDGAEEDDVELSFDEGRADEAVGRVDAAALDQETDGLFDTLDDDEPMGGTAGFGESGTGRDVAGEVAFEEEARATARSSAPPEVGSGSGRKSDLKQLLRAEMDPDDFPRSEPPREPAAAEQGALAQAPMAEEDADEDDFELLVDEDDIEELDIDDDEFELVEED